MNDNNAENNEAQAVDNAAQEEKQTDNHLFTQEDVDRTVESRLARERKKYDKELDRRIAEYDRQAKLSEEEREAERRAQSERELAEKELQITLRENLFNAKNVLIEKGISHELAELVVDADVEKQEQNIATLEKQFGKAVEAAVAERLKGSTPKAPQDSASSAQKYGEVTVI